MMMIYQLLMASELERLSDKSYQSLEIVQAAFSGIKPETTTYWTTWLLQEDANWWSKAWVIHTILKIPSNKKNIALHNLKTVIDNHSLRCKYHDYYISHLMEEYK